MSQILKCVTINLKLAINKNYEIVYWGSTYEMNNTDQFVTQQPSVFNEILCLNILILVKNEKIWVFSGYEKLKWSSAPLWEEYTLYNQVEMGSTYPLYKSTILGPLYVINQYQNLTVHRNPSYLQ